jgi:hypothetical protein
VFLLTFENEIDLWNVKRRKILGVVIVLMAVAIRRGVAVSVCVLIL